MIPAQYTSSLLAKGMQLADRTDCYHAFSREKGKIFAVRKHYAKF
ncbi:MAG: hypothetical protein JWR18_2452 [Segetibacter sp.]|nr:hypothetical protein [Segetibacter sp.]